MFADLSLYPGLQKALDALAFSEPTDVQSRAIPAALTGKDLLVSAQTGSGKTFAYLIPAIQRLVSETASPQAGTLALILVPTRELARQVLKQSEILIAHTPLHALLLTGGEPFKEQIAELRRNPEIVIATPGRLVELLERKAVDLDGLQLLILDEADRMLDMGFGPDVLNITSACNPQRQTLLFSATLQQGELPGLIEMVTRDPETIDLSEKGGHQDIQHLLMLADDRKHKEKLLAWILKNKPFKRALIFTNTRDSADRLGGLVRYHGHNAGVLHGEKEHKIRKQVMSQFSHNKMTVLIASDVAARGLDVPEVELVINFDMPRRGDDYLHRTGRTGRAGNHGTAVSFVAPQEWNLMAGIQRYLKMEFEPLVIKELKGEFTGPRKVKSSGKAAGKKKKKFSHNKDGTTKNKQTAGRSRSSAAKKSTATPGLTGNETVRRRSNSLQGKQTGEE